VRTDSTFKNVSFSTQDLNMFFISLTLNTDHLAEL